MPVATKDRTKPILGYRLIEKIGAGGYGEVWEAEAPGGLKKAVKFVFGFHDEDRAIGELKSLNRIKEVRHPFLLSLERIEVVDGQLVVISELADMSLKDRFDECRKQGLLGIPQEELLRYLRDAADALDYIVAIHALQHLDIKPENLLIVGGHIKVADFGLVKEIQAATMASMMGGLTPIYAPPELFDGRPCAFSDQYSLSIVYQEMLTGIRPFGGQTPAQLAAQHLQAQPNLEPLSDADRVVVGRALSKEPKQRFSTCLAFIDSLQANAQGRPAKIENRVKRETDEAEQIDFESIRKTHAKQTRAYGPLRQLAAQVIDLPPIQWDGNSSTFRPVYFIGIGHTASKILFQLRRKVIDQFGQLSKLPSVRFLCIDSDRRSLDQLQGHDTTFPMDDDEVLNTPLRRPDEYRTDSTADRFKWLSRRWLFNIPRSLQTEGIRPLGRLAFVDSASEIMARIRVGLASVAEKKSLDSTAKRLDMSSVDCSPIIFVVASISGGVGSGSVLDMGYAVRKILSELGLDESRLHGILTYWTSSIREERDLALGNTYACLSELYHYHRNDSHPGDETCSLPRREGTPFESTYVVQLGDDANAEELTESVDNMAQYLYLNSMSPSASAFDMLRQNLQADSSPEDGLAVRTIGLSQIGCTSPGFIASTTQNVCNALSSVWLGDSLDPSQPASGPGRPVSNAEQSVFDGISEIGFSLEQLIPETHQSVDAACQAGANQITDIVDECQSTSNATFGSAEPIIDFIENAIGCLEVAPHIPSGSELDFSEKLETLVTQLAETPAVRIGGAKRACERLIENLKQWRIEVQHAMSILHKQITSLVSLLREPDSETRESACVAMQPNNDGVSVNDFQALLNLLAKSQFKETALGKVQEQIALFETRLLATENRLNELSVSVKAFAACLSDQEEDRQAIMIDDLPDSHDAGALRQGLGVLVNELAPRLDEELQQNVFRNGFLSACVGQVSDRAELCEQIRYHAQRLVRRSLATPDVDKLIFPAQYVEDDFIQTWINTAMPSLLPCGGARRIVVSSASPATITMQKLVEAIENKTESRASFLPNNQPNVTLCSEVEGVPLANIAYSLLSSRPDCAKYAHRLHTRIDVAWSTLTDCDTTIGLQD